MKRQNKLKERHETLFKLSRNFIGSHHDKKKNYRDIVTHYQPLKDIQKAKANKGKKVQSEKSSSCSSHSHSCSSRDDLKDKMHIWKNALTNLNTDNIS